MENDSVDSLGIGDQLYLDLLKKCLTRYLFGETWRPIDPPIHSLKWALYVPLQKLLSLASIQLVRPKPFDVAARAEGRDWPYDAETMIGLKRLDNLQFCITDIVRRKIPGDLIETGVWRGGSTIFMRAVLKVLGDKARTVWVADSFQGLPKPNAAKYQADAGDTLWSAKRLAISLEQVKSNFARYGLLDDQVRFLVGWFSETLPTATISQLSLLRLDGDMYESTMDALRALYHKVSVGGYVVVDDFYAMRACEAAVEDFRREKGISDPIKRIDWTGVFWQRSA